MPGNDNMGVGQPEVEAGNPVFTTEILSKTAKLGISLTPEMLPHLANAPTDFIDRRIKHLAQQTLILLLLMSDAVKDLFCHWKAQWVQEICKLVRLHRELAVPCQSNLDH